jgi:DNA replication protein DnaC
MRLQQKVAMNAKEGFPTTGCTRCGGSGVVVTPHASGAEAAVCSECSRHCRVCRDSRYLFERDALGREIARMCVCEQRRVRVRLYNEARIPGKYAGARLEDRYRDRHNHRVFGMFRLLAKDYRRGQRGLVLMGAPGVGKSWLVSAFLYELIFTHGVPALYRDFFHLLSDLRSGYSQDKPESELIDPLVEVEVLVIDELGKGRNTPWEQNILDVIISQRYNAQKTTIFTSNYTDKAATTLEERIRPKDGRTGEEDIVHKDTLSDRVGPRIFSRLKEMCDFETIIAPDRREPDGAALRP